MEHAGMQLGASRRIDTCIYEGFHASIFLYFVSGLGSMWNMTKFNFKEQNKVIYLKEPQTAHRTMCGAQNS